MIRIAIICALLGYIAGTHHVEAEPTDQAVCSTDSECEALFGPEEDEDGFQLCRDLNAAGDLVMCRVAPREPLI